MKTLKNTLIGSVLACGMLLTSCGNGVSTTPVLKTDVDSVSFAYGSGLYSQALSRQLEQIGLISDTLHVYTAYYSRISREKDEVAKAKLQKEMRHVMDSVKQMNNKNLSSFFRGVQEGIESTDAQKAYITGLSMGSSFKEQMFPGIVQNLYGAEATVEENFSKNFFLSGMLTSMSGSKSAIADPEQFIERKFTAMQQAAAGKSFEANKEIGAKFLAENKTKDGVVTLASGVQYKVIKEGKGAKPSATDKVKVHYKGTLIDGTEFDSSFKRNEPAEFGVNQVIKGWTEALQLMPVGSKWELFIPSDLAYGTSDMGTIKPYSTLIFEVELLEILE